MTPHATPRRAPSRLLRARVVREPPRRDRRPRRRAAVHRVATKRQRRLHASRPQESFPTVRLHDVAADVAPARYHAHVLVEARERRRGVLAPVRDAAGLRIEGRRRRRRRFFSGGGARRARRVRQNPRPRVHAVRERHPRGFAVDAVRAQVCCAFGRLRAVRGGHRRGVDAQSIVKMRPFVIVAPPPEVHDRVVLRRPAVAWLARHAQSRVRARRQREVRATARGDARYVLGVDSRVHADGAEGRGSPPRVRLHEVARQELLDRHPRDVKLRNAGPFRVAARVERGGRVRARPQRAVVVRRRRDQNLHRRGERAGAQRGEVRRSRVRERARFRAQAHRRRGRVRTNGPRPRAGDPARGASARDDGSRD
eukprot:30835-Pelagococcus_subviridis.AAC.10